VRQESKIKMGANIKIAIAFFGIARSLKFTIGSIDENVIAPLRSMGDVRIFGHLYDLSEIRNPRSGESCMLEAGQHTLIDFDELLIDEPNKCLARFNMSSIFAANDPYLDNFTTVTNLLHQLNSLDLVTTMIQSHYQPDLVVFVRPDLCYHDSFLEPAQLAARACANSIFLPAWQRYGGYNDRFAICDAYSYVGYGSRAHWVDAYLGLRKPLISELFLLFALRQAPVQVCTLGATASRVRGDGRREIESFAATGSFNSLFLRSKQLIKHRLKIR
jgi:hypothetical protein